MQKQLIGIFVIHTLAYRNIVNFIIFKTCGVPFFVNHTLDALVCNITANVIFIVGAEDEAAVTAFVLCIHPHQRLCCCTATSKKVQNQSILFIYGAYLYQILD